MKSINGIDYVEANSAELCELSIQTPYIYLVYSYNALLSSHTDPCSGASDDWFILSLGVRFAFTLELRNGANGHIEDAKNIIPTGKETWAGFKIMLKKMIELSQ